LTLLAAFLAAGAAHAVEVTFERDASLPLVYINVAVKSGAVSDPAGESGLTNFVGEMLLRGSKSRTKEQIDLDLDQMGARLEAETRAEALMMRGAVLAAQLDPFLKLVAELVTQPSFPEHEIRKLKKEVESQLLEELGRDSSLAGRRFNRFLFGDHPYGKPVLGTIPDVQKLTRERVEAHYDRLFRDKALLVLGAGDADEARIRAWAETLAAARPGGEMPAKVAAPANGTAARLLLVDKPDRTQTQIFGGQVGIRMTDDRFFPLYLGNHAFGGGSFSARMMVEIRVKRGWSYGAYSYFRHGRQPRSWTFHLFPASKDTPAALERSLEMVRELREKGITQEEFAFAKQSLVNSAGFMYNTPQKRVENRLLERTLDLPDGFMKSYGPRLENVTLAQVNSALKEYLQPDRMAITVLGTAKDLKGPLAKAAGLGEDRVTVVPYTQE
jgi:zinc protease